LPLDERVVKRTLKRKFGFKPVSGSRHDALAFYRDGMKIATTRFSRGSGQEIDDTLLGRMAVEIRVRELGFFKGMINCNKSLHDFLDRLSEGHYI
jgi:hypothetical protein